MQEPLSKRPLKMIKTLKKIQVYKKRLFCEEKVANIKGNPWEKVAFSSASMFSWVVAVETSKKLKWRSFPHKTRVLLKVVATPFGSKIE